MKPPNLQYELLLGRDGSPPNPAPAPGDQCVARPWVGPGPQVPHARQGGCLGDEESLGGAEIVLAMGQKSPRMRGFHGIIKTAPKSACNTRRGLTHSPGTSREGLPVMVPKTCSIDGCDSLVLARGWCNMHYKRILRNGTADTIPMDPMSQFLRNTQKTETCWLWTGYLNPENRGVINFKAGKMFAYRLGYELLVGPIPEGLTLDHLCVNPRCVNPDHLEPVTGGENSLRGSGPAAVNKRKTHCIRGHELAGDNLYLKPNGRRRCRKCEADAHLRRKAQKMAA